MKIFNAIFLTLSFAASASAQLTVGPPPDNGVMQVCSMMGGTVRRRLDPLDSKVGGLWQEFLFDDLGSEIEPACGCVLGNNAEYLVAMPPFEVKGPAILSVTDAFIRGDRFKIMVNGQYVGETSAVPPNVVGTTCGPHPDNCFNDPTSSSGTFMLGDGDNEIRIFVAQRFDRGAAYFRLDCPRAGCKLCSEHKIAVFVYTETECFMPLTQRPRRSPLSDVLWRMV